MNQIEAKKEIIRIASDVLNNNVNLIEACRTITGLSCDTDNPEDDIYNPFVAVDSETDHFPMGSVRDLCDPEYLARIDKEIERYIELANNDIRKACYELIKKLSNEIS